MAIIKLFQGRASEARQISASKFREQCFSLIDNLGSEGLVITKRGKPVAKVVPLNRAAAATSERPAHRVRNPRQDPCAQLIGSMKGQIKVRGNIFSTGLRWDAES